jgi:carboxyl-terminal processing protease
VRDGKITILNLLEGYSAQKQGLQPGDRILAVDGNPISAVHTENVRGMTRGPVGTEVRLLIERDGELQPLEFVLIREEIQLKNITYAEFIGDGVAYIRLERFSKNTADEFSAALNSLLSKGEMKGLILDLRDNPGGLLNMAVSVVEKFVPKGSLVVSMKGKKPESEQKYFAAEEPLIPDIPLVVLVDGNSASASEIVAGAIQDLDRGIILGTRSFGKGLVQTIAPLVYNTQLKITTAKYYTPSGRCIQLVDYSAKHKDSLSGVTPDSLRKAFKTSKGRSEFEKGGILPDTVVASPEQSKLQYELFRKAFYYRFASRFTKQDSGKIKVDDKLFNEFRQFLVKEKFSYKDESETKLDDLLVSAKKARYSDEITSDLEKVQERIAKEKLAVYDRSKQEILSELRIHIMSKLKGEHGRIEASLIDDVHVKAAKGLLMNKQEYSRRLASGSASESDQ